MSGNEYKSHNKDIISKLVFDKMKCLMMKEGIDVSNFNLDSNFFEIGINSIILAEVVEEVDKVYPSILDVTDFFSYDSINEVSYELEKRLTNLNYIE